MIVIREERPQDIGAVRSVNEEAFGQPQEAGIVDRLREACDALLSLVAILKDQVVGHILFSPAVIDGGPGLIHGMGLAPMAILPGFQRQGIGSALVRAGLDTLRERDCFYVFVLGHPEYYPRFGFVPAARYGVRCQWEGVPDEAFMVLVLDKSVVSRLAGVARYRDEFNEAM